MSLRILRGHSYGKPLRSRGFYENTHTSIGTIVLLVPLGARLRSSFLRTVHSPLWVHVDAQLGDAAPSQESLTSYLRSITERRRSTGRRWQQLTRHNFAQPRRNSSQVMQFEGRCGFSRLVWCLRGLSHLAMSLLSPALWGLSLRGLSHSAMSLPSP